MRYLKQYFKYMKIAKMSKYDKSLEINNFVNNSSRHLKLAPFDSEDIILAIY